MLKLSANLSMLFTELPFAERFAAARAHGFDAVEIQFPYEFSINALQDLLLTHQLRLVLINVPAGDLMQNGAGLAGVPDREREFKAATEQALHYASLLNVPCVNVLPGRQHPDYELAECLHVLANNLTYAADVFAKEGITTCFEAINTYDMPHFLISGVAQMQEIMEVVRHPRLKMQFDIYHMTRMGEDVYSALREYISDIGHIQFADHPGRGAPGTGHIDFAHLFRLIAALPYDGYCGAEYRPQGPTADSLAWIQDLPR